jgi:hypothetical protein
LALIGLLALAGQASPPTAAAMCTEWRDCERLTNDAIAARDFERAHDLAWRAVQTGPPRDTTLMYLLARAQALSGRAHDALVMLLRLADAGVGTDAPTRDEFRTVRTLPGWSDLEAKLRALASPAPERRLEVDAHDAPQRPLASRAIRLSRRNLFRLPAARRSDAAIPVESSPETVTASTPAAAVSRSREVLRVAAPAFTAKGLAYDRVSGRFVLGDPAGQKLVVLDERSRAAVDLVRGNSAGFGRIAGLELDPRRGDLWVVSNGAAVADHDAVLHHLQLISGRPLASFRLDSVSGPARFRDVAVTPAGSVLVLDDAGRRVFRLDSHATRLVPAAVLSLNEPTSIAAADDHHAFVAYAGGVARIDLTSGATVDLREPSADLTGIDKLHWTSQALIALQRNGGGYRLLALHVGEATSARVVVLESKVDVTDPGATTLSADGFYFVASAPAGVDELTVRRIVLP